MQAVAYYEDNPSAFGGSDQLDLAKYAGNTPQLVADLINPATTGQVSVALQAVIARQASDWGESHINGWSAYSDEQKAAFTTAYSALGEAKLNSLYQDYLNAGNDPATYTPD